MMQRLLLLTLFLPCVLYASSFERYCFSSKEEAHRAQKSLENIKAPVDSVNLEANCLVVSTSERRVEIIQKYLLKIYPTMSITFSSSDTKKDECLIKVEKETVSTQNRNRLGVQKTVTFGNASISSSKKEISSIRVTSGEDFKLSYDEQTLVGNCRYISPMKYEIKFSLLFTPKEVNPYDPSTYKQKEGTSVSTSLVLSAGQRVNVASIASKLNDEAKELKLLPHVKIKTESGNKKTNVFLFLDDIKK